ncbi:MAG: hypothetical protein ACYDEE_11000 [Ignavibacteriaceae bacterium]
MSKNISSTKHISDKIDTSGKLQVIDINEDSKNTPYKINIPRNKKFNAKDILRLHSNLIRSFINGSIESNEAKTLSYLCSNYLEALQGTEIEEKLKAIEERIATQNEK